jgi:hypothetical protein
MEGGWVSHVSCQKPAWLADRCNYEGEIKGPPPIAGEAARGWQQ